MTSHTRFPLALVLTAVFVRPLFAADWPAYRHDFARSGATQEKLVAPLHRQWTYLPAHKPMPAWPEPGRELNRLDFDYVFHVAVADGLVFFGSSADHKIYALDLATGRERWSFFTEAPVRFAPAVEAGRVFVASDDGHLYCLAAPDGKLLWRFYGGPRQERMFGNGRLISRWPLRSGVAVENGVVYVAAGMWPSEGVYVYALRARDGTAVWENGTSGTLYIKQPHGGSFAMTGSSPQGIVLGHKGQLFVPTGRNVPAAFDRSTGKMQYYRSAPSGWINRWGGCWNILVKNFLIGWKTHHGLDFNSQLGAYPPDAKDGLVVFDATTGKELREVSGPLRAAVEGDTIFTAGATNVHAYDLAAWVKGAVKPKWEATFGRADELIVAGGTVVVGGHDTVGAFEAATGKKLWEDKVDGQVRGLAVADGRLLASTTEGAILCYGSKAVGKPITVRGIGAVPFADGGPDTVGAKMATRIMKQTGMREGICLALGAGDGRALYYLAKHSDMTIYCVDPDAKKVAAARKFLVTSGLYGVRVTVHQGALDKLSYPDFCADLVIAGNAASLDIRACSAAEIYRVLRPGGGTAILASAIPAGEPSPVDRWLAAGEVPNGDITTRDGATLLVRSALPGAGDWTHQYATAGRTGASTDGRARLPLKLLWFGEPGPARLVTRHWGGPAPLCVDGRMFAVGQFSIIAVDAYNGRQLWLRDFGKQEVGWHPVRAFGSAVVADRDSLYVLAGKECLRLDSATGKTVQTYQLPPAPDEVPENRAQSFIWSYVAVAGDRIIGAMGGRTEAKCVFAFSKAGRLLWKHTAKNVVNINSISTDGRQAYVIDHTSPAEVSRASKRGLKIERFRSLVALAASSGEVVWQTEEGIAGRDALWLSQGVLVATSGGGISGYSADDGKLLYHRPASVRRFPVIAGGTIYIEPVAYDLRTGEQKSRDNPFTGDKTAWRYQRSYGCGAISGGQHVLMFRSGTLGIYDLAGDGGVHNVGAIRAGCYVNAIAAAGLVLAPPSDAGCTCSYSLRTTVALAPSNQQRNWSIFYDRLPRSSVKQAALNLGAPGDRRDAAKTIWLAMPRPDTRSHRKNIAVPFRFTYAPGFGPYRRNAERVRIAGTDRPWLYASGLEGLVRADIDLEIFDRGYTSWPCGDTPAVDGHMREACWDGYKSVPVSTEAASVTLRHDAENLYLAYRRPNRPAAGWKTATQGPDAAVWQDNSVEVYLSNAPKSSKTSAKTCLHLGVSASGARYDALWTYVTPALPRCDIPRVTAVIDGKPDDWGDQGLKVLSLTGPFRGLYGMMRPPDNFNPSFKIGWNDKGLLMLIEVTDNVVHEWENAAQPWMGDSVQLFLAPERGSAPSYQCVVTPGPASELRGKLVFFDDRKNVDAPKLTGQAAGAKTPKGYFVEVLLPWSNLGITPAVGVEFAMQLYANDDDIQGPQSRFTTLWHPSGDPRRDPLAYQTLRLADKPTVAIDFRTNSKKAPWGFFQAIAPFPIPVQLPAMGANGEDAKFDTAWTSAVQAGDNAFTAELAIPWKTLAEAGLDKSRLLLNVTSRGPLRQAPKTGSLYERLFVASGGMAAPRKITLRLHFAEIEDVRPGERVFDVKVQGKTVLEDFDVVKAAGGRNRAIVKEIEGVSATRSLALEFVPKTKKVANRTAPILSAIEIVTP